MAEPTRDKPIQGIKLKLKLPSAATAASNTAEQTAGAPPATVPSRPKIKLNVGKPANAFAPVQAEPSTDSTPQVQTESSTPAKHGTDGIASANGKAEGKTGRQPSMEFSRTEATSSTPTPGLAESGYAHDDAMEGDRGAENPMDGVEWPLNLKTAEKASDAFPESETHDGPPRVVKAEEGSTPSQSAAVKMSPPLVNTIASVTFAIPKRETNTPAPIGGDTTPVDRPRSASVTNAPDQKPLLDDKSATGLETPGLFSASAANSEAGTPLGLDDDGMVGTRATTTTPAGGTPGPSSLMAGAGKVVLQGKGRPYLRAKKPLKEVLKRILADIRRKDVVSLCDSCHGPTDPHVYFACF